MKHVNKLLFQLLSQASNYLSNMLYKYVLVRQPKYLVMVEWWNDSVVRHDAIDMKDAIEWMQCYPDDVCITVRDTKKRKGSNYGNIVASRGF